MEGDEKEQKKQNSLANLIPFKDGPDPRRNKIGRPVVSDIKKYFKERLNEEASKDSNFTRLDAIVSKLLDKAFTEGNLKAVEMCLQYGFGKPSQSIEVKGIDGAALLTHDFSKLSNEDLIKAIDKLSNSITSPQPTPEGGAQ